MEIIKDKLELSILNAIGGSEITDACTQLSKLGFTLVDLKDSIFEKSIALLNEGESKRLRDILNENGIQAYCLASNIFGEDISKGETWFTETYKSQVGNLLKVASVTHPTFIRLLSCFDEQKRSIETINHDCPWLIPLYKWAISEFAKAGYKVTIENEGAHSIFSNPNAVREFFNLLGGDSEAGFTWDIQNLWQQGTFPSRDVYEELKPVINYIHLKGGIGTNTQVDEAATLRNASWPVNKLINQFIEDGISPVLCLNPSHGKRTNNLSSLKEAEDNITYLKELTMTVST